MCIEPIKVVGLRIYSETPVSGAGREFPRKRATVAVRCNIIVCLFFFNFTQHHRLPDGQSVIVLLFIIIYYTIRVCPYNCLACEIIIIVV